MLFAPNPGSDGPTTTIPAKERPRSMEHLKDEELVCANCGVTFVFSAAAASARAERGLTTKPTMCKPCWRARPSNQERNHGDGSSRQAPRQGRGPRQTQATSSWGHRNTGDVNEYRSPMPDPHFAGQPARSGWSMQPEFGRRRPATDGNYRAPSFQQEKPYGGGRPNRERFSNNRHDADPARARNRISTDITCATCGAASTVPFKPAEGQKVYCRACYQSEKPT